MKSDIQKELVDLLNKEAQPIIREKNAYDFILEKIGNARIVLLGEATHGSEDFYQIRIELTKKLIKEKGFHAIAIEGDWPAAFQVHQYVIGESNYESAMDSLTAFKRFPKWMWRNTAVLSFIDWLKEFNDRIVDSKNKIGFYGLDLYSLYESMKSVIDYLEKYDLQIANQTQQVFKCFDHTATDPEMYGYLVNKELKKSCVSEVTEQFLEIQHQAFTKLQKLTLSKEEALYFATQNARIVKNAEQYYRAMFETRATSWNIRDAHMEETVSNLLSHLETKLNVPAKIIIWAHNSHIGDARATEMWDRGELNIGQLIREKYDLSSYSLGFSTYTGTVSAATDWDGEAEIKTILPALSGSYEALFHEAREKNFFINFRQESHLNHLLKQPKLQRAIGVIYLPETERWSHYHFSRLPYQFDGLIHIDETEAVTSIDAKPEGLGEEFPETYPTGI